MKISLFIIVDYIFKFILIFLLNLIWCLYFINKPIVSILVSVFLTLLIIFISNKVNTKRNVKTKLSLAEKQKILNITNTFIYMSKEEILDFFYKLASTKHNAKKLDNFILINNQNKNIALYPLFKNKSLSQDDLIEIYNNCKIVNIKKILILTNKIDSNCNDIIENLSCEVVVLDNEQTYTLLLKEYEFYPEIKIKPKPTAKKTFKQVLHYALNKKRTKSYIISALFLLFSSLFVRFKLYYLLFASILLTLAIFSRFNTIFNKVNKLNLLD